MELFKYICRINVYAPWPSTVQYFFVLRNHHHCGCEPTLERLFSVRMFRKQLMSCVKDNGQYRDREKMERHEDNRDTVFLSP